jgi:hypothetical protein
MFEALLKNWKSTVFGLLAGTFGALALTPNIDTMDAKQLGAALLACVFVAVQGLVTGDAKKE